MLLYLAKSRSAADRVAVVLSPFRSVKFFGAEFVLGEEEARRVAKNAEDFFREYGRGGRREYDRLARMHQIREKLEFVVGSAVADASKIPSDLRATIHVPDFLFADTLFQLLDYYPTGGGGGRSWSIRFGIIGKAWRLRKTDISGQVSTDPQILIQDWGMTREEAAAAGRGRKSFAAILLQDPEDRDSVGVFYMDSMSERAFGATADDETRFGNIVNDSCKQCGLISALVKLNEEVRSRTPQIEIYGKYMSSGSV